MKPGTREKVNVSCPGQVEKSNVFTETGDGHHGGPTHSFQTYLKRHNYVLFLGKKESNKVSCFTLHCISRPANTLFCYSFSRDKLRSFSSLLVCDCSTLIISKEKQAAYTLENIRYRFIRCHDFVLMCTNVRWLLRLLKNPDNGCPACSFVLPVLQIC